MRPFKLVPVLILCFSLLLSGCSPTSTTAQLPQTLEKGPNGLWGVMQDPVQRPHTELYDKHDKVVDLATAYPDKMLLVFMGYTNCPDICPVHLAMINRALDKIGWRAGRDVEMIFIASDTYRDQAETVQQFTEKFNRDFIGLHAKDQAAINKTAEALGLPDPVIEGDPKSGKFYTVGHAGQVMVFDAKGPSCISYPFGVLTSNWIEDLPKLKEGVCK